MTQVCKAPRQFEDYQWENDAGWQEYLANLYPTPSPSLIEKYKAKYYKQHVDPSFDIGKLKSPPVNPSPASAQAGPAVRRRGTSIARQLRMVFSLLGVTVLISAQILKTTGSHRAGLLRGYGIMMILMGSCLDLLIEMGVPHFSLTYWQNFMVKDSAHNIFMTFNVISIQIWISIISPIISSLLIGFKDFQFAPLDKYARLINSNEMMLRSVKSDIEVYTGFVLFVLLLGGRMSFLPIFMHWNLLRLKYTTSPFTQATFRKMNRQIEGILLHPSVPGGFLRFYRKATGFLSRYGDPSRN